MLVRDCAAAAWFGIHPCARVWWPGTLWWVTGFVVPYGAGGVFPWDVGSVPVPSQVSLGLRYGLPQCRMLGREMLTAATRASGSVLGCSHVTHGGSLVVGGFGEGSWCGVCDAAVGAFLADSGREELLWEWRAALALAHWSAWLSLNGSGSAALCLSVVVRQVREFGFNAAELSRLAGLLADAEGLLGRFPPVFEASRWASAAVSGMFEESLVWASSVTAGASRVQALRACRWLAGAVPGLLPSGGRSVCGNSDALSVSSGLGLVGWVGDVDAKVGLFGDGFEPSLALVLREGLGAGEAAAVWALPAQVVDAVGVLSRSALLRGFFALDPGVLRSAGVPVSERVASVASGVLAAAPVGSKLGCVYDAVDAAQLVAGDPVAVDTVLALAPEWVGTGVELGRAALGLVR